MHKILLVANTAWNLWNYRRALIHALQNAGYEVVLAAPDDHYRAALETDTGARFHPLRHLSRSSLSVSRHFRLLLEFCRLFRREKPALILLFTIKPNTLGNIAARLAGIPAISVLEGLGSGGTAHAPWRLATLTLYRLALRRTRKVVFLNADDLREFQAAALVKPDQCELIPGPGVDTAHFAPMPAAPHPLLHFCFAGRMLADKGVREFAAAARLLRQEKAPAAFYLLGAPDPGNPTTLRAAELENWARDGRLIYHGSADDVRPFLAAADVLVLPSYYREGVPRAVLEAMAMGKIILTTDTPGCRDTVEEGRNGFLVPPRDVKALAAAMHRIMALPPGQRREMGLFSRQKVLAEFSDERVLACYLALVKTVTNDQVRSPGQPTQRPIPSKVQ